MTFEEIIRIVISVADKTLIPKLSLVALLMAESGLSDKPPYFNIYAERYGEKTEYAKTLVSMLPAYGRDYIGNWTGEENRPMTWDQAWEELMADVWPDVSFGGPQITVQKKSFFGDGTSSFENVMAFREACFDIEKSLTWAANYYKSGYYPSEEDAIWKGLNRYNWPAGNGAPWKTNGDNYRRNINNARKLLAQAGYYD